MLIKGTTLNVEVPLDVEVELQLVDAKMVELDELVVEALLVLLVVVVEVELDELVVVEDELEELELGAVRIEYAPTPAITTTTTMITAIATGAIPLLF